MLMLLKEARACAQKFQRVKNTKAHGTAKDNKRLQDNWVKRENTNVRGYWNTDEAKRKCA